MPARKPPARPSLLGTAGLLFRRDERHAAGLVGSEAGGEAADRHARGAQDEAGPGICRRGGPGATNLPGHPRRRVRRRGLPRGREEVGRAVASGAAVGRLARVDALPAGRAPAAGCPAAQPVGGTDGRRDSGHHPLFDSLRCAHGRRRGRGCQLGVEDGERDREGLDGRERRLEVEVEPGVGHLPHLEDEVGRVVVRDQLHIFDRCQRSPPIVLERVGAELVGPDGRLVDQ
mmetsp:Transcript_32110/g.103643  ORF Transcript_32110/g.103643 Transcript_32110/m.103643 type:complete len:231 (+) Transcript_32110:474-1166(+)